MSIKSLERATQESVNPVPISTEVYTESVSKVGPGLRQSPGVEIPASGSYVPNMDPLAGTQPRELSRSPGPTFETLSVYPNNLKNRVLTVSALPQNLCQTPDSSGCLGIAFAATTLQSLIRRFLVEQRYTEGLIRSSERLKVHTQHFCSNPLTAGELTARASAEIPQIQGIINKLAKDRAIVPSEVWHITTWDNLSSICKIGSIFGAATLQRDNIGYSANILCPSADKSDLDTICFGSNLIDPGAILEKGWENIKGGVLKKGVIQIKTDLSKVNPLGTYVQFFKVKDLCCPEYRFKLKITDWFSLEFCAREQYGIFFKIDGWEEFIPIESNQIIVYGSLYQANKFCLTTLFNIIEKSKGKYLVDAFYKRMKSCSELELIKIMKLFGHHLTIFSEINFHSRIDCTEGLIREIYDLNTGKGYSLRNLEPNGYRERINSIAYSEFIELPSSDKKLGLYDISPEGRIIGILGNSLSDYPFRLRFRDIDYSNANPEEFISPEYVNYFERGQTTSNL